MKILFKEKDKKLLSNPRKAKAKLGESLDFIEVHVASLTACDTLQDFFNLGPTNNGRCHMLKGNLKSIFSVDLNQPFRMLFVPDPPAERDENGMILSSVKSIKIVKLKEDTH